MKKLNLPLEKLRVVDYSMSCNSGIAESIPADSKAEKPTFE